MSVQEFAQFTALLSIVAMVTAIALVVFRQRLAETFSVRMALAGALAIAASSTAGSLIFSDGYGLEPCQLCWYQRIAMYPLVVLLGIALFRADRSVWRHVVALAGIGSAVSVFHLIVQWTPAESGACAVGVPCSLRYVEEFGFVTIPFMALAGFLAIMAFTWLAVTVDSTGDQT